MKRVVVFLVIGPLLVALASFALLHHGRPPRSDWLFAIKLFLSISTASILVGLVDGHLARTLSVFPRMLLTALVGAVVAWPLANAFFLTSLGGIWLRVIFEAALMPELLPALALFGVVYAGICSLLANDWAGLRFGKEDWGS